MLRRWACVTLIFLLISLPFLLMGINFIFGFLVLFFVGHFFKALCGEWGNLKSGF